MRTFKKTVAVLTGALLLALGATTANADVTVGFTAPLSGPAASPGRDQLDGFMLAIDQLHGKLGGQTAHIIKKDVGIKPQLGVEAVRELVGKDHVDVVVGLSFSNVLIASVPKLKGTPAIATNAGPAILAGKDCQSNVFSAAWQNDGPAESIGAYLNNHEYHSAYLMAPNYQAGKNMLTGFKRYFKGKIIGETYTRLGQSDYLTNILQVQQAKPDALFVFYPGAMGVNFVKQLKQSGTLGQIPFYSVFTLDYTTLPAIRNAAVGSIGGLPWSPVLKNAENQQFVKAFQAKYHRMPSFYAASAYDAANILNVAVKDVGSQVSNHKALSKAIMEAGSDFKSVRGPFQFNTNHMPIQNYYIEKLTQHDGKLQWKILDTVKNHKDAYYTSCHLN